MDYPPFFQDHRIEKRAALLAAGKQPYPYSYDATHSIENVVAAFDDLAAAETTVRVAGRLLSVRSMGKSWFLDVIDRGARIQFYMRTGMTPQESLDVVDGLDIGDWIGVAGTLFRTRTGESTLQTKELVLLGKAVADVPFGKVHDGTTSYTLSSVEVRRQKRYLDWITDPDAVKRFEMRSRVFSLIRRYMEGEGFLEVDTPTLELVYGGAEARPFRTNVWALGNQEVFLNVSLELPLKRYIVGGFPKVFAIARCYRNEGIDATHNPEFTLMEWYEAFTDYERQMARFEELTCHVVKTLTGGLTVTYQGRDINFAGPWRRISVPAVIEELFGCPLDAIDRAALEADIDRAMSDEKLSTTGMTREQFRREVAAEHLGALVMRRVERHLEETDQLWQPCFICDQPRDISPLTKVKRGNPLFVERFEPHIAGFEVGNSYSELTDPVEQYERFMDQRGGGDSGKDYEDHPIDMDFVHAIACGMPPTGGVGFGIDRLVMILTGKESIRDVIPFPMRLGRGE